MRRLLQVPIGLRRRLLDLADKHGDVLIDIENCYGGCDIAINEAKALGVDKIIHYGHSKFMESPIPVDYVEYKTEYDPLPVLRNWNQNGFKSICLIASAQFLDTLPVAKQFFESKGVKVILGRGRSFSHEGQILGCDAPAVRSIENDVDAFLFIGSGKFHPLGLGLETKKQLFRLDVERNEVVDMKPEIEKFTKQKFLAIGVAQQAQSFGIIVSTKPGQQALRFAEEIKKKIVEKGKKAYILVVNELREDKLYGINVDCFINTACPRIGVEDRFRYEKPMINSNEAMEIFK